MSTQKQTTYSTQLVLRIRPSPCIRTCLCLISETTQHFGDEWMFACSRGEGCICYALLSLKTDFVAPTTELECFDFSVTCSWRFRQELDASAAALAAAAAAWDACAMYVAILAISALGLCKLFLMSSSLWASCSFSIINVLAFTWVMNASWSHISEEFLLNIWICHTSLIKSSYLLSGLILLLLCYSLKPGR